MTLDLGPNMSSREIMTLVTHTKAHSFRIPLQHPVTGWRQQDKGMGDTQATHASHGSTWRIPSPSTP